MEPISTLITAAVGYILKSAASSKTADTAKEQLLGNFWKWIRPKFIKTIPEIEAKAETPEIITKTQEHLVELVKDEPFFQELQRQIHLLRQANITEKNIAKKDIINVGKIRIGDKTYEPGEAYHRKNIVEGDIRNADEFTLGDGH